MEEIKEIEICRRTTDKDHHKARKWMLISLCWMLFSFLVNVIVSFIVGGRFNYMFKVGGPFWAGFGNMILGFVGFIVFLILSFGSGKSEVILTNKRLILAVSKKRLFAGLICYEKSYLLNRIVSFESVYYEKRKMVLLSLRNANEASASLVLDKDFYDKFAQQF